MPISVHEPKLDGKGSFKLSYYGDPDIDGQCLIRLLGENGMEVTDFRDETGVGGNKRFLLINESTATLEQLVEVLTNSPEVKLLPTRE